MEESLQDGGSGLFGRQLDKNIATIDLRFEGGDISVGRHPADGAISNIKAGTMARAFQLVAVEAAAGQWPIVVGAAILEGEDLPVDFAQDNEELTDLVDKGLSLGEIIEPG